MGSNMNFKNFTTDPSLDTKGHRPQGTLSLTRQPSVYSLTFDEFQNTMVGLGKDYGSMNMDELLKNIWSAEETQGMATSISGSQQGIQRQGSLTLPRTLSHKTVDDVWKDIAKEYANGSGVGRGTVPHREPTLGEMTLEEFLMKSGVVREDSKLATKVNTTGDIFGDLSHAGNNSGLGIGFQQNLNGVVGLSNSIDNQSQISMLSSNMPLNGNGVRINQAQVQQQQQMFPKQPNVGYVPEMPLQTSPAIRGGIAGIGDQGINSGLIQGGGMGLVGPRCVATGSPADQLSSDGIRKSNGDTSSMSPVPYAFNGGLRGRRVGGGMEKVVERRQRRMIKNRESAARSRARKQAYTTELEEEIAKLKEENQELQRKQEKVKEMHKIQVETINLQHGGKKQCLRRTETGPW